jgi:hypothetical protein
MAWNASLYSAWGKTRGKMHAIIRDKRQILEREIAKFFCKFASLFPLFLAIMWHLIGSGYR